MGLLSNTITLASSDLVILNGKLFRVFQFSDALTS